MVPGMHVNGMMLMIPQVPVHVKSMAFPTLSMASPSKDSWEVLYGGIVGMGEQVLEYPGRFCLVTPLYRVLDADAAKLVDIAVLDAMPLARIVDVEKPFRDGRKPDLPAQSFYLSDNVVVAEPVGPHEDLSHNPHDRFP